MRNGWTGGQYGLLRASIGGAMALYLLLAAIRGVDGGSFAAFPDALNLLAWTDGPMPARVLALLGAALASMFALGFHDRVTAVGAAYAVLLISSAGGWGDGAGPAALGFAVVLHLLMPRAPYASWAARGRVDPAGDWVYTPRLFAVAWLLLGVGYLAGGVDRLLDPGWIDGSALTRMLEGPHTRWAALADLLLRLPQWVHRGTTWFVLAMQIAAIPLFLIRPTRRWTWLVLAATQWICVALFHPTGLGPVLAVLHLYTFDPDWIAPLKQPSPEIVFYDGSCGLCHRSVRFALAEDRGGDTFRYAPLDGDVFRQRVPEHERADLPDSIIVQRRDGSLLDRSEAVLYALQRLGGIWRPLGFTAQLVPRALRDGVYDGVARIRHRIFPRPDEACPILPPDLRSRFDL